MTVIVRDINDNPPQFDRPIYEVFVSENQNSETDVVQVSYIILNI